MTRDPDKKDTSRGLGKPPPPPALAVEPEAATGAKPAAKDTLAKLFESDTITVSAETQRQWSMAERPRAKQEELVETLPPNQTKVKPPDREGESASLDEASEVAAEHSGPTAPPKPHDRAKFEPERRAPSIDVSKANDDSFGADRAQITRLTPRTQKRRLHRAALAAGALLVLLGATWFVTRSGAPSEPNTSSAKPETEAPSLEPLPAEPEPSQQALPEPEEPAPRANRAEQPEWPHPAAMTPATAERSPAAPPVERPRAFQAPRTLTTPKPAETKPSKPTPAPSKTPNPNRASGKADAPFDPTQPIYR